MKEIILIFAAVVSVFLIIKAMEWLKEVHVSDNKRTWLSILLFVSPPIGALLIWCMRDKQALLK